MTMGGTVTAGAGNYYWKDRYDYRDIAGATGTTKRGPVFEPSGTDESLAGPTCGRTSDARPYTAVRYPDGSLPW
jgi:hypothetical protein